MARKKTLVILFGILMALAVAAPALAAPAAVDVYREVGDVEIVTSDYLDKTFEITGTYNFRVQEVTNGNKTFYKLVDIGQAQAVDIATGEVYKTIYKYSEVEKNAAFTMSDTMRFVGPGPANNLFMTFKYVYNDGTLIRSIESIEIR